VLALARALPGGAPGGDRTPDLQLRRLPLYPTELLAPDSLGIWSSGEKNGSPPRDESDKGYQRDSAPVSAAQESLTASLFGVLLPLDRRPRRSLAGRAQVGARPIAASRRCSSTWCRRRIEPQARSPAPSAGLRAASFPFPRRYKKARSLQPSQRCSLTKLATRDVGGSGSVVHFQQMHFMSATAPSTPRRCVMVGQRYHTVKDNGPLVRAARCSNRDSPVALFTTAANDRYESNEAAPK
jgi:hypothetical protein